MSHLTPESSPLPDLTQTSCPRRLCIKFLTVFSLLTIFVVSSIVAPAQSSSQSNSTPPIKSGRNAQKIHAPYSLPEIKEEGYTVSGVLNTVYETVFCSNSGSNERAVANVIPVNSTGFTSTTPTAADNDYTRISSAVDAAMPRDTLVLNCTFNFAEPFAAASCALGNDGVENTLDDYSVLAPLNRDGVTITANNLGDATIQGPSDLPGIAGEGIFQFYSGGTNKNWTISNIKFVDIDNPIGFTTMADRLMNTVARKFLTTKLRLPPIIERTAVKLSEYISLSEPIRKFRETLFY